MLVYGVSTDWGNTTSNFSVYAAASKYNCKQRQHTISTVQQKQYKDDKPGKRTHITALKSIHFDNRFGSFGDHTTNKTTLWTLSLIGVFSINGLHQFINLSTALTWAVEKWV
jgi:hypothetical protein